MGLAANLRIHFLVNHHRQDAAVRATGVAAWALERGHDIHADQESGALIGLPSIRNAHFSEADLVVTFGGDGTLIRAAHLCAERGTPILGIHYGRFGFVTQCPPEAVEVEIDRFCQGHADFEERMMIQTQLLREGKSIAELHSLNEAVLQRSADNRMLIFRVSVNDEHLTSYPADGVIVSTPTGSTAYNLSAGGPVMDPSMGALVVTAIAPHTLSARPLVLSPDASVRIGLQRSGDAVVSADGLTRLHLLEGDEILVTRSNRITRLVQVEKGDFLQKLRDRLFWSKGMVEPS